MSRCARCGLPNKGPDIDGRCYARLGSDADDLRCRDREIANLRSLLRSVTGKLEKAAEELEGIPPSVSSESARMLIDQVLEELS